MLEFVVIMFSLKKKVIHFSPKYVSGWSDLHVWLTAEHVGPLKQNVSTDNCGEQAKDEQYFVSSDAQDKGPYYLASKLNGWHSQYVLMH